MQFVVGCFQFGQFIPESHPLLITFLRHLLVLPLKSTDFLLQILDHIAPAKSLLLVYLNLPLQLI